MNISPIKNYSHTSHSYKNDYENKDIHICVRVCNLNKYHRLQLYLDLLFVCSCLTGADVILWPEYIEPLLQTIRWLLSFKPRYSHAPPVLSLLILP